MLCRKSACFYCAKGQCVRISVLTTEKCDRFLSKKLSGIRPTLRPLNLVALRARIDSNAPIMPKHASALQERDARMLNFVA